MRMPLAAFILSKAPEQMSKRVKSVDYVEYTNILGVPTDHLAGRTDSVDFEIWIEQGKKPVPRHLVLTYRNADGAPQYRATFADWNFAPQFKADNFAFGPPKDSHKIPFATQMKQAAPGVGEKRPGGAP
jgi:hypothetical protein